MVDKDKLASNTAGAKMTFFYFLFPLILIK